MLSIRKVTDYDDQIENLRSFTDRRQDVGTTICSIQINKEICRYLASHVLSKDVSIFLEKLVETDAEDIESLKHDECYDLITTWREDYNKMVYELDEASYRDQVRSELRSGVL